MLARVVTAPTTRPGCCLYKASIIFISFLPPVQAVAVWHMLALAMPSRPPNRVGVSHPPPLQRLMLSIHVFRRPPCPYQMGLREKEKKDATLVPRCLCPCPWRRGCSTDNKTPPRCFRACDACMLEGAKVVEVQKDALVALQHDPIGTDIADCAL
jgi:hypothetical protein